MKFIFEVIGTPNQDTIDSVRHLMLALENLINSIVPAIRVHLREEE